MSDERAFDVSTEGTAGVVSDPTSDLGAVAYGLFMLNEPGPLSDIAKLQDTAAACIPAQEGRSVERDIVQEKLLGELGDLDL